MKRLLIMLLVLICLSGCGNKKQEEKKEEKQEQQVIIRNSVPRNLQGSYHERYAGRASLELGSNTIIIDWSSSASQKAHFEIPVNYDEDNQRLVYENAVLTEYEFRSDTESKDTEVYNDGSGHFDILNGILIWYDDKAETDDPTVFVSNDGANSIANPWFYTTDLSEAIIYSGIDFCPPTCLDVKDGRVVKGVNFAGLSDVSSPVELGRYYSDGGADELVFYDITASAEGRALFTDILRQVAETIFIPLTVGGGIGNIEDFDRVLKCGADKVSVNSGAIRNPSQIGRAHV